MNTEFVVLRLIHILFGVFWAGTAIFLATILEPRLRKAGPQVMQPVMGALMPILTPAMMLAGTVTIVFGAVLTLRLRSGHLDTFFDAGWGVAILIGFVASVAAFTSGMITSSTGKRLAKLGASIAGREPTPVEMAQMQKLGKRLTMLTRTSAVMVTVAVGTMAAARFV